LSASLLDKTIGTVDNST